MIRVLIAEDEHLIRAALVALLELEPAIEVVAEVAGGNDILPAAHRVRPDVAVIDIDLPGMDGLSAAVPLRQQLPECRILILTSLARPGTMRRALSAKVDGFLVKNAPAAELSDAIRKVAGGLRVIDSRLALEAWDTRSCPLTARELEVLRLCAEGKTVMDIAAGLLLTHGTVRNYLTSAAAKLHARNRIDAIRIASDAGWM
ncbi:MAG TPA: response regulator transcription factor [Mycobacteriales bacterium]|nr:response regulator transcription factor [Mycobacteriales bacterium]